MESVNFNLSVGGGLPALALVFDHEKFGRVEAVRTGSRFAM